MYLRKGEATPGVQATDEQVSAAISTSFLVLIGIFFPSVTGKCRYMYYRYTLNWWVHVHVL